MRAFNLEEAKAGKPVCTRDGDPARIICFDRDFGKYPIIALVRLDDGEYIGAYSVDGIDDMTSDQYFEFNLMMADE